MARIKSYENDPTVQGGDKWIGTDITDNSTRNFTVDAIAEYFATTGKADPSGLGFVYDFNLNTLQPGQFQYTHSNAVPTPANVTDIIVTALDRNGKNVEPFLTFTEGSVIFIADRATPQSVDYAAYRILRHTSADDIVTFQVEHLASSGDLSDGIIGLSFVGTGSAGGGNFDTIRSTTEDPNALNVDIQGNAGDYLIRTDTDANGDLLYFIYGPLRATGSDWDQPTQLNVRGPQGIQGIQGLPGTDGVDGDQGDQGAFEIDVFQRAATIPATPVGGSYDLDTNILTPPAGWIDGVPAGTDELWESRARFNPATPNAVLTWTLPFQAGAQGPQGDQGIQGFQGVSIDDVSTVVSNGETEVTLETIDPANSNAAGTLTAFTIPQGVQGQFYVRLYWRENTDPTNANVPNDITYRISDGDYENTTADWNVTPPTGDENLWAIQTIIDPADVPDITNRLNIRRNGNAVGAGEFGWTVPYLVGIRGQQGIQGIQGLQGVIGETGPGYSSVTIGTLDPATGQPFTLVGSGTNTDVDLVAPIGPQGDQGDQGDQGIQGFQGTYEVQVYRRSATAVTISPADLTWTAATNALSGADATGPTGWSLSIPSGTDQLYIVQATFDPSGAATTITTWSAPFQAGAQGPIGMQGPQGDPGVDGSGYDNITLGTRVQDEQPITFEGTGTNTDVTLNLPLPQRQILLLTATPQTVVIGGIGYVDATNWYYNNTAADIPGVTSDNVATTVGFIKIGDGFSDISSLTIFGDSLPDVADAAANDVYILDVTSGDNRPGLYRFDGTNWINLSSLTVQHDGAVVGVAHEINKLNFSGPGVNSVTVDTTDSSCVNIVLQGGGGGGTAATFALAVAGYSANVFSTEVQTAMITPSFSSGVTATSLSIYEGADDTGRLVGGAPITANFTDAVSDILAAGADLPRYHGVLVYDESLTPLTFTTDAIARNKTAPSGQLIRFRSVRTNPAALNSYIFRNNQIENSASGTLQLEATVTANDWTVTSPATIPFDIDQPVVATDTANIVPTQVFEFDPPAGATDVQADLTARLTFNRINSLRIAELVTDTITTTELNDLTNWNVTGDDTSGRISGASYRIQTIVGSYSYFAVPTAAGTPIFEENGFSITLNNLGAVGAHNIYRSRNVARSAQTLTYTITF